MTLALLITLGCVRPAPPPTLRDGHDASLREERLGRGAANQRLAAAPADLVVLFRAEDDGSLVPCGCEKDPRGGLARVAAYLGAQLRAEPTTPRLVLHAGGFLDPGRALDGSTRPEAALRNARMAEGLIRLGFQALNLTATDLAGLPPEPALPLVSASLEGDGLPSTRWLTAGDRTVAVVGLAAPGPAWMAPAGYQPAPASKVASAIHEAQQGADLVVLLVHGQGEQARRLALQGEIDLVIEAGAFREAWPPFRVGEALWVRAWGQGTQLHELRLELSDGGVRSAVLRHIALDESLGEDPDTLNFIRQAEAEAVALEKQVYGRPLR